MQKWECILSFVLFCLYILLIARAQNDASGNQPVLVTPKFVLLSDDLENEMLDFPRTKEISKEVADRSVDEIVAHLYKAGEKWSNGRPQDDDISFVVLKVNHITD
jgi:hypothetical protein